MFIALYPACNAHAPYCHLWSAPFYNVFPSSVEKSPLCVSHKGNSVRKSNIINYNIVVNRKTCFGLFRDHYQVLRLLAIGGFYRLLY